MFRIIIALEFILLVLWVFIESIYTKTIFSYLFLFVIYFFILLKIAPRKIHNLKDVLVLLIFIFFNLFIVSLILMEIGDYFYNNTIVSKFGVSYKPLIGFGYSLFYFSILFFLIDILGLIILRLLRKT